MLAGLAARLTRLGGAGWGGDPDGWHASDEETATELEPRALTRMESGGAGGSDSDSGSEILLDVQRSVWTADTNAQHEEYWRSQIAECPAEEAISETDREALTEEMLNHLHAWQVVRGGAPVVRLADLYCGVTDRFGVADGAPAVAMLASHPFYRMARELFAELVASPHWTEELMVVSAPMVDALAKELWVRFVACGLAEPEPEPVEPPLAQAPSEPVVPAVPAGSSLPTSPGPVRTFVPALPPVPEAPLPFQ